jgi:hypothetical protein
MTVWGPQGRRAAVSITFETLRAGAGTAPDVSPALTTLLQILAERELAASFFVEADIARAESLAPAMIAVGRHEIGALLQAGGDLAPVLAALDAAGFPPSGLRAAGAATLPPAADLARAGIRHVSGPGTALGAEDGIVRIPVDPHLVEPSSHPGAWHQALQVAIGRAVQDGEHLTVTFVPGLLERADALAVVIETLDLVAGLRRAGRLWTPTLDELAAWWLAGPAAP